MVQTIGTIIAVISAIVSVTSFLMLIKHRTDTLTKGEDSIRESMKKDAENIAICMARLEDNLRKEIIRIESNFRQDMNDTVRTLQTELKDSGIRLNTATTLIQTLSETRALSDKFVFDSLTGIKNWMVLIEDKFNSVDKRLAIVESRFALTVSNEHFKVVQSSRDQELDILDSRIQALEKQETGT